MPFNKREFLKLAGLSLAGLGLPPALRSLAEADLSRVAPRPGALVGKRWGMVVNLRACREGCNDCRVACHRIHNVPAMPNPGHEIKWIWTEPFENAFPGQENLYLDQSLKGKAAPVLCNHCDNPPCVRVCPTKATFKRPDGIVMMDYHRCIGCRYCVAGCPYGSRSFNWLDPRPYIKEPNLEFPARTKGVVEKCTFCEERLAKGLIPACVEACKDKALVFGDLEDPGSEVRALLGAHFSIRRKPELGTQPQIYYLV